MLYVLHIIIVMPVVCRNMINVAAQCYKATLAVTSGLSAPYSNLALIYKQQVYINCDVFF